MLPARFVPALTATALAIVVLAVANRGPVTLRLLPDGLSMFGQRSIELPMHLVGLALILTGMILGYIFEWLREHKHRRRASIKSREAAELNREVTQLRKANAKDDDVLALIGN